MSTERTKTTTEITVELSILDSILESPEPVAQMPKPTPTPTPTPDEPVDWKQLTKIMLQVGRSERTSPKQKRKIRFCATCGKWDCNIHPVEIEID